MVIRKVNVSIIQNVESFKLIVNLQFVTGKNITEENPPGFIILQSPEGMIHLWYGNTQKYIEVISTTALGFSTTQLS